MVDLSQTGVYCITNTVNGKRYVGSASTSFRKRWNVNLSDLRRGTHHSGHLQRAFKKHGEQSFEFAVILVCAPGDCLMYEQRFIDHFASSDKSVGYNISPTAGNCLGVKHTPETKAKLSAAHRGKTLSADCKAKLVAANRGRKKSPEELEKLSAALRGRKHGPERIAKMAAGHRGKKQRPEVIAKRAAALRGRKRSPETIAKVAAATAARK